MSTQTTKANNKFEIDVTKIRNDAREHMDAGAVTAGNTIDIERLIVILNEVIATEIVCYLRYSHTRSPRPGSTARRSRPNSPTRLRGDATRSVGRGAGQPARWRTRLRSNDACRRSHTEYVTVDDADLKRMLTENLVLSGSSSPATRRSSAGSASRPDHAQADGEDPRAGGRHADDLNDLLGN